MATLEALTKAYRAKKAEAAKLRKKGQNTLKETLSIKRRSSSGLASIERKKESLSRQIAHVSQLLTQHRAQKDSISRLRMATEERLKQELDLQDNARQQIDFGAPEGRAEAEERLKYSEQKIADLKAGMKEREAAESRLDIQIRDLEKEKAKLDLQVRKQGHIKPELVRQLKTSAQAESVLRPRVQSLIRREEQAAKALHTIEKKLAAAVAQRKKAARRKAAKKAKRKPAKKAKRKAAKRRPARKARAKTRASRARTARRPKKKASRKRVAKRRPSRTAKKRASKSRRR